MKFLRRISSYLSPDPWLHRVSIVMNRAVSARIDLLAKHTNQHGDAIVDLALREWLANHEAALLEGSEEFNLRPREGQPTEIG